MEMPTMLRLLGQHRLLAKGDLGNHAMKMFLWMTPAPRSPVVVVAHGMCTIIITSTGSPLLELLRVILS
jgi:hypothetical protein